VSSDRRPNILFAFADDWGRYASAYRQIEGDGTPNAVLETPNFDRVAREGVLFTNAIVPAPSCTPCRSALLAGRYFWRTGLGAILQGAVWDSSIPSYPLILEEAGMPNRRPSIPIMMSDQDRRTLTTTATANNNRSHGNGTPDSLQPGLHEPVRHH